jgi:hypothetical protein
VIYRIDSDDRLVFADGAFHRFADAAGVPNLPLEWLGKSFWSCIGDDELRAVFVALVARARAGSTVRFHTRCDSPTTRRTMTMELAPIHDGGVEFRCTFGSAELTVASPPAVALLLLCAWCSRGQSDGEWRNIEEVVATAQLLEHSDLPVVTHGICDACLADTAAELDALATA